MTSTDVKHSLHLRVEVGGGESLHRFLLRMLGGNNSLVFPPPEKKKIPKLEKGG